MLTKANCPAEPITIVNPSSVGQPGGPYIQCDEWHATAIDWLNSHHPDLLVMTQISYYKAPGTSNGPPQVISAAQWSAGLTTLLHDLHLARTRKIYLGDIPRIPHDAPACIAAHHDNVQACSSAVTYIPTAYPRVEKATMTAEGVRYVDVVPWLCSIQCTAIVDRYCVYLANEHITAAWAVYLENVLADAIGVSGTFRGTVRLPPA